MAPSYAFGWSSYVRNPECPEETHLSDLVTTWPSHMPTPYRTRVAAVRGECFNTAPARQLSINWLLIQIHGCNLQSWVHPFVWHQQMHARAMHTCLYLRTIFICLTHLKAVFVFKLHFKNPHILLFKWIWLWMTQLYQQ